MMKKPRGMAPSMGMKKPAQMETDASMPDFKARALRPGGMAKGGKVHSDAAMDRKLIREEINKAHKKMGMAKGGSVKGYAKGGMTKGKK